MWEEIQDMPGEIFDVEQAREDIRLEKLAREEEEEFLDICFDLLMEGIVDEDAIEEAAHAIMNKQDE